MDPHINQSRLTNALTFMDKYARYVPVLSTINSIIGLIAKKALIPNQNPQKILENRYFKQVSTTSTTCYVLGLFPVIGNLIVFLKEKMDKVIKFAEEEMKKTPADREREYKRNIAIKECKEGNFRYIREQFRGDSECLNIALDYEKSRIVGNGIEIVYSDGGAIRYASDELKNNRQFALKAIKSNPNAYHYISENLKSDPALKQLAKEVGLKKYTWLGSSFETFLGDFKDDSEYIAEIYAKLSLENGFVMFNTPRARGDNDLVDFMLKFLASKGIDGQQYMPLNHPMSNRYVPPREKLL